MFNVKEILSDERGTVSAARTFLLGVLLFTGAIIVLDSLILAVPEIAYTLLGSLNVGLLAWAGGPRVAQYLAPQIGSVAAGIAKAVREPRRPKLLDNDPAFRDDER
mgnify:CR=1 FL=1